MMLVRFLAFIVALLCPHVQGAGDAEMTITPTEVHKYFHTVEGDMTKITWVHRCNSRSKLENALNSDAMMIEADIIAGHLIGDSAGPPIPVMGHPPEMTGDISLEQFLDTVLRKGANKGIKLDFKSTGIFKASENVLEQFLVKPEVVFPVWVNADILKGPGHSANNALVDADYFLSTCVTKFPMATISVGWSVDANSAQTLKYNSTHIDDMTSHLADNHVVQPVTFAVHAGIASNSVESLSGLVHSSVAGTSLTLWAGPGEWVNYLSLRELITALGKDKVFVDMPTDMKDKLLNDPLESKGAHIVMGSMALFMIGLLFIF